MTIYMIIFLLTVKEHSKRRPMIECFSASSSNGGDRQKRNTSNNYNESIGSKIYTR